MTRMTRRQFGLSVGAATAALAMPSIARAQSAARVVVIGGGPGGLTAAKYIAKGSAGKVAVTLVEPLQSFTTCFFSNLYLGGFRSYESLGHTYDAVTAKYGIKKISQMAQGPGKSASSLRLGDGTELVYDRLVVSPGIDVKYESVPGYSEAAADTAPHAWKPGKQTQILKAKLDAIADGQTIVMVAPPNPFRCPPGPYERVSMMAHILKTKGVKGASIIVLDPKDKFSKQGLFQEGWEQHYPGVVQWIGPAEHGGIKGVDVAAGKVMTDLDTFEGALLNVIPAQKAGAIADAFGLVNETGYCPINPETMLSAMNPAIYVLGDASIAGDMPKSAFSANSQAKVAANAILAELAGGTRFPAKYTNTCWSLIETDDGVKVGAAYEPKDGKITAVTNFISQTGETAELRKATYQESLGWYAGITADMFS